MAPNPIEWTPRHNEWHPPKWLTWSVYVASVLFGAWLAHLMKDSVAAESRLGPPVFGGAIGLFCGIMILRICELVSDMRNGRPIF